MSNNTKQKLKEYHAEYYQKNKEKIKKRTNEYKRKNKDKVHKRGKEYYLENKEKINKKHKEYREENKEKEKIRKQKYYIKVKDKRKQQKLDRKSDINYVIANKIYLCKKYDIGKKFIEKKEKIEDYIDVEYIKTKLEECKNICKFCHIEMKTINFSPSEQSQFSVDRIDNNLPHLKSNCQIICLNCNTRKKRNNKPKERDDKNIRHNEYIENRKKINYIINSKLGRYRRQDYKNHLISSTKDLPSNYITLDFVKDLIKKAHGCCEECGDKLHLTDYKPYDPKQFTIDRILNRLPHIENNVWLSCLECNTKRSHEV